MTRLPWMALAANCFFSSLLLAQDSPPRKIIIDLTDKSEKSEAIVASAINCVPGQPNPPPNCPPGPVVPGTVIPPGANVMPGNLPPGTTIPGNNLPGSNPATNTPNSNPATTNTDPAQPAGPVQGVTEGGGEGLASRDTYTFGEIFGSRAIQAVVPTRFNGTYLVPGANQNRPGALHYNASNPATYVQYPLAQGSIVNPSGGAAGWFKMSEYNSPVPRDRVFLNYDLFNSTVLAAEGADVHRFTPGIEWAFLEDTASIEVRVPFAGAPSSTQDLNGTTVQNVQLGNVSIALKYLFLDSPTFRMSTGVAVTLPTAKDYQLNIDGDELFRIKNETVMLQPYLAGIWTPNPRLFAQAWGALLFDPAGNRVIANTAELATSTADVGRLRNQTVLSGDLQVGYWLLDPGTRPSAFLSGLAPFLEVRINETLNDLQAVSSGSFSLGGPGNRYTEVNLIAGAMISLGSQTQLSFGYVQPLADRQFDWQFGARMNYFFGGGARRSGY